MRAGYLLHSLECLECGVVGKCCSNVLRSLCAHGVAGKAVRHECVRKTIQSTCVAHDARSHYTQPRVRLCTSMHTCMPTYQIQTRVHALHVYLPSFQCTTHKYMLYTNATHYYAHSREQAMYCTHMSVWSVELWASAAAMCCAPSAPMELSTRLYAHMCVRRTIQRMYVDHDARSHTYNRERGHTPVVHWNEGRYMCKACTRVCVWYVGMHVCMQ
jgi:hypothetical protein